MKLKEEEIIEKEYHVSWWIILYKLFLGLIESGTGLTLLIYGQKIFDVLNTTITKELLEDPHDLLVNITEKIIPSIFTHNTYIIIYLLILGVAKIAGAVGLINKKNWGVDLLVSLTILLFPFQIADIILSPSVFKIIYVTIGVLIALYLVEFKPKSWISRMLRKI